MARIGPSPLWIPSSKRSTQRSVVNNHSIKACIQITTINTPHSKWAGTEKKQQPPINIAGLLLEDVFSSCQRTNRLFDETHVLDVQFHFQLQTVQNPESLRRKSHGHSCIKDGSQCIIQVTLAAVDRWHHQAGAGGTWCICYPASPTLTHTGLQQHQQSSK